MGISLGERERNVSELIHETAICETSNVGKGTRIWAFVHVLPQAVIGENCNICDHVFIENDVVIGDRVTVKSGVQLWDGVRLANDVFVGPNATFTNDKNPRSKQKPPVFLVTNVEEGASIGANATILPGITIGRSALIGAGSVVTSNVPPYAIVVGNPARISGYVGQNKDLVSSQDHVIESQTKVDIAGRATLSGLTLATDMRGSLSAIEFASQCPFTPKRLFLVHNVPSKSVRGEHAHRECHQFLVAVAGTISISIDSGTERETVVLSSPSSGLYIPPMTWGSQFHFSSDAVLLVLASHEYDDADYIRDYETFRKLINSPRST
jgi:UDP-2-acetamido-3-amino-2,3-dideoxy-glucuronate N-acetyltransferase